MTHKTKVIAIRITEQEYEGLQLAAKEMNWSVSRLVYFWLEGHFAHLHFKAAAERKKAEAKAKRQAKKEAASGL